MVSTSYLTDELNTTMRNLDATFAALADPTRRAIVARLAKGDATVLELAEPFDISLPAISRHLKVLEQAGLIARERDANRRPCRLVGDALTDVVQWAEHTRRAWEERFDRLDEYLRELQARGQGQPDPRPTKEKNHVRKHR
ncbi:MAG TPA: metalloregulator ArsR/SmtB family transcription factor [Kofleriaceae bacterium]|nr:metalloregulator ArsR/SmtB family transcription factor [Kofleriaceae bacterium]